MDLGWLFSLLTCLLFFIDGNKLKFFSESEYFFCWLYVSLSQSWLANLKLTNSTTAALEVITSSIPIQCLLDTVPKTEFAKIIAKDPEDHLRKKVFEGLDSHKFLSVLTPTVIFNNTLLRFCNKDSLLWIEKESDRLERLRISVANWDECVLGLGSAGVHGQVPSG